MSERLRRRVELLEREHRAQVLARQAQRPARRWALLSLYVRGLTSEDVAPWREQLAQLPAPPDGRPAVRRLSETEPRMRGLALLCREARADNADYRGLLVVALGAGLANERQAQWIREQILDAADEKRLRLTPMRALG